MAALLHFEEKVHKRRLRGPPFDYFSLGCFAMFWHIWVFLQTLSFSLEQWTQLSLHQHSPELPEPREVPPAPSTSVPSEPVPEAASSDAPPAVPPTAEPPITIPGSEYHALLASFQTLTTTQTAIMERMDHFQTQQDQQTLILREIQHLGLVPPAPHAVPSSIPEDPPIHRRSLLLDHTITPLPFLPYYQEVSLPPFYYHFLLEHWGQCSS
ncbi:hypothetical protein AAG906_010502 [Vitis piasezkii]